jgi:hypothetical protein
MRCLLDAKLIGRGDYWARRIYRSFLAALTKITLHESGDFLLLLQGAGERPERSDGRRNEVNTDVSGAGTK